METKSATGSVAHSLGANKPRCVVPPDACDSHMHIFDPRFSPSPHWKRTPPRAEVSVYRALQERLGTSRAVVVTPSTYGIDNTCTLDALKQLGYSARGVAVVDSEVAQGDLDKLAANGVCGLRVNFVSPQSWGETRLDMLATLAGKVARLDGWHIQIFAHAGQLRAFAPVLLDLPVPVVVDHMGLMDPSGFAGDAEYAALCRLIDHGHTWVKLSGAYMRSTVGEPDYADTMQLGRSLVKYAPERLVWGSDWPHTTQPPNSVNDAHLLDLLYGWCGTDACFHSILVDNPAQLYGFPVKKDTRRTG